MSPKQNHTQVSLAPPAATFSDCFTSPPCRPHQWCHGWPFIKLDKNKLITKGSIWNLTFRRLAFERLSSVGHQRPVKSGIFHLNSHLPKRRGKYSRNTMLLIHYFYIGVEKIRYGGKINELVLFFFFFKFLGVIGKIILTTSRSENKVVNKTRVTHRLLTKGRDMSSNRILFLILYHRLLPAEIMSMSFLW